MIARWTTLGARKPSLWVLMHVPKTAGASLTASLADTMGRERVLRKAWFDELVEYSKARGLGGVDLVSCHIAGRELGYLEADRSLRLFTFLRDPVARVLSTYRFWRQETPDAVVEDRAGRPVPLIDLDLDWQEDLARVLALAPEVWKFRELTDAATWQFATSLYEREGRSGRDTMAAARRRLKSMAFVGFQEQMGADYERLCRDHLGVGKPAPLQEINRTDRGGMETVPAEVRSLIEAHNGLDLDLFHWARSRFKD